MYNEVLKLGLENIKNEDSNGNGHCNESKQYEIRFEDIKKEYRKTAIRSHGFYCKKQIFRMACIQGRTSNDVGLLLQETNFYFKITDTFQVINEIISHWSREDIGNYINAW